MTDRCIIACNRAEPLTLSDSVVIRGRRSDFETTAAPCIRGFVLTLGVAFAAWRTFVTEHADHASLIGGDLFSAATLSEAVERCRLAPPKSSHPPFLFCELELLREAAE